MRYVSLDEWLAEWYGAVVRRCAECGALQSTREFHQDFTGANKDGLKRVCKTCEGRGVEAYLKEASRIREDPETVYFGGKLPKYVEK